MSDLIRTARGVTILTVGDQVLVHNSDTRQSMRLAPRDTARFVTALLDLDRPRTPDECAAVISAATGADGQVSRHEVEGLLRMGVLVRGERDPAFGSADSDGWTVHGWDEAFRYHRHTRVLPIVDWSDDASVRLDVELMRKYVRESDPPSQYLDREHLGRTPVPRPETSRQPPVRAIRDTVTAAPASTPTPDDLYMALALTFGVTGHRRLPVTGLHLTKTSPSGGSRHPVEAFVALLRPLGDLAPGLFHWNVRDNALDRLAEGDHEEEVRRHVILLPDRPGFVPTAVVVLVALVERSMYRYRESRSYRVLYLDAGHLLQTFAYTASARGRPTYRGYSLHEDEVTDMFGLDPLLQLPLAYGILG
jgi:SagB-type dehydrogenase family enzyme